MARITAEHVAEVLTENYRRMLSRARQVLRSEVDAEDAVQDVMLTLLRAPDMLSGVERVTGWLLTMVYRRSVDIIRRERRRDGWDSDDVIAELFPEGSNSADMESDELVEAVYGALNELPEDQRFVILANAVEGISFKDISEETGVPMGTLMARKKRGLDRIRARLREQAYETGIAEGAQRT